MLKPHPDKKIEKKVGERVFLRYPVRTRVVKPNDELDQLVKEFALEHLEQNDLLVFSERIVAITQGRIIHESQIKAGFWARNLIKFVKKWPKDPGFRNAKKMQLAINLVGLPKILFAAFISALTKPFGVRGLFYKIAGHDVAEIDGFAPGTVPPYDQYAVLGPKDPSKVCAKLAQDFKDLNLSFAIVDANNIDVAVLGFSSNSPLKQTDLRQVFLDNPIGQGLEQTPICIIREKT